MKWKDRRRSSNVNRGQKAPLAVGGISGLVLMLVLYFIGIDPSVVTNGNQQASPNNQIESQEVSKERETLEDFLSVILADTEDVWHEKFKENNANYNEPQMTLYQDTTKTGCGVAQSRMGPFYCPVDQTIYFDVSFYNDMKSRFGGGGDFALAYVLAHEVGHHVQNELGIIKQTNELRQRLSETEYNRVSVAQELQADYFAGLFAYYIKEKGYLDEGDIDEAMASASAIGDDRIQEMAGMNVDVDSFTHGSSEQRKEAFELGYKHHDIDHSMKFFNDLKN
mgnify:CR=1 FL=1